MSKKYSLLAKDIINDVGGANNIKSFHHCQTRLRFVLCDNQLVNIAMLEKKKEILQVLTSGGELQLVIGMTVAEVYEELVKQLSTQSINTQTTKKKSQKPLDIVTDFISSVFSPIIPALAGAGMVKALLSVLIAFKVLTASSQTYIILNIIGDATFAFLPMLLAASTAKKLKTNPYLAIVVAGIICHPTWATLVAQGKPIHLFNFLPVYSATYVGSVIPIILIVLIQAPIEKWLNRVIPNSIKLVFAPMLLFIIMGILAFVLIAPLGDWIGSLLTGVFTWLGIHASWAPPFILGGVYSILVVFGLHHSLAPIGMIQLTQMGYDSLFGPGVLLANVAQGTAGLIVGVMSKNKNTKQIGTSAGITGLMGVTEPVLYGLNLPKKYPLIAGCIGSACGGLIAGILGVRRFATGSSGLPAIVMYIGNSTMRYFYAILLGLFITVIVTSIMTTLLFKKNEHDDPQTDTSKIQQKTVLANEQIYSPVCGTVIPLKQVKDSVFSQSLMGKGIAIEPNNGVIRAPFDGKVTALMDTKHAIGITSSKGCEILIHIGLETVKLNGNYFEAFVKKGEKVKKGQKLLSANISEIKKMGYETQIPITVTNSEKYQRIDLINIKKVKVGDLIIEALNR